MALFSLLQRVAKTCDQQEYIRFELSLSAPSKALNAPWMFWTWKAERHMKKLCSNLLLLTFASLSYPVTRRSAWFNLSKNKASTQYKMTWNISQWPSAQGLVPRKKVDFTMSYKMKLQSHSKGKRIAVGRGQLWNSIVIYFLRALHS